MANSDIQNTLNVYKALSDETRLRIVRTVAAQGKCETAVCVKGLDLTQPTLSHHIKILIDAKILLAHKEGTCKKYMLNETYLQKIGVTIGQK
jgi:ArsR family transcriptional regulator, arsenate/arsenite/antimonite-responsive transcriptional repressor